MRRVILFLLACALAACATAPTVATQSQPVDTVSFRVRGPGCMAISSEDAPAKLFVVPEGEIPTMNFGGENLRVAVLVDGVVAIADRSSLTDSATGTPIRVSGTCEEMAEKLCSWNWEHEAGWVHYECAEREQLPPGMRGK